MAFLLTSWKPRLLRTALLVVSMAAVSPCELKRLLSAPLERRMSTHCALFRFTAQWSAVQPLILCCALISTPENERNTF